MRWTFFDKPADVKGELDRQLTWSNETGARRAPDCSAPSPEAIAQLVARISQRERLDRNLALYAPL